MAGKFEITKAGDGTFSFELFIDDNAVGKSPVFDKEDACKRGVKAVKKNSRMKVQNTLANDEEKTNPKYLVEADGDKVKYTLFLQTGHVQKLDRLLVPFGQSVLLYNTLKENNKDVTFYCVENADHGGAAFWNNQVLEITYQFLKEHIKKQLKRAIFHQKRKRYLILLKHVIIEL